MHSHQPTLLVVSVLPERPGDVKYNRIATRLWERMTEVASTEWKIASAFAQFDGAEIVHRLAHVDAVVLMGGEDLHPVTYGAARGYSGETRHWYRADQAYLAIVRHCVNKGLPLLGICRGMQAINVALGGDLIQDIASRTHANPTILDDHILVRHDVAITPLTRLAEVFDNAPALTTSSAHHQAVSRLGNDLRTSATAADGTVEAIEHLWAPVTGVQWHPEDPADDGTQLARLLGDLHNRVAPRLRQRTTLVA